MRLIPTICKYCGSSEVIKYGTFEGMQRYFCNSCNRKFAANHALSKMKTPIWVIATALESYYNGLSLTAIQEYLDKRYGAVYSTASIYNWVIRFSSEATTRARLFKPVTGDTWLAHETSFASGRHKLWLWDVVDIKTGFLLISRLSETRESNIVDLTISSDVSDNKPDRIATFSSNKNGKMSETIWYRSPKQLLKQSRSAADEFSYSLNLFSNAIKARRNILLGVKKVDVLHILSGAWQFHYNFISTETGFLSPARRTGTSPFRNWEDILGAKFSRTGLSELPGDSTGDTSTTKTEYNTYFTH